MVKNTPRIPQGKDAPPRSFSIVKHTKGQLLLRLWKYLGRNRLMLLLALALSVSGSLLALYGPKLSGQAINSIARKEGVDFPTVYRCVILMAVFYVCSAVLSYLLNAVMIRLSKRISKQMRRDIFEKMTMLPVSFFDRFQTGYIIKGNLLFSALHHLGSGFGELERLAVSALVHHYIEQENQRSYHYHIRKQADPE